MLSAKYDSKTITLADLKAAGFELTPAKTAVKGYLGINAKKGNFNAWLQNSKAMGKAEATLDTFVIETIKDGKPRLYLTNSAMNGVETTGAAL